MHEDRGRTLIVGASGDIGSAVVGMYAGAGMHLALIGRSSPALRELRRTALSAGSPSVLIAHAELTKQGAISAAVSEIASEHGPRIDNVVYTAGDSARGGIVAVSWEEWQRAFEVKLFSAWELLAVCHSLLDPGTSLIFVTGESGQAPSADYILGGVNAALCNLIKAAAVTMGPRGFRVNGVSPGPVAGRRFERRRNAAISDEDPDGAVWKQSVLESLPLRRLVNPMEVAKGIDFLARSAGITGEILSVSAGRSGYYM